MAPTPVAPASPSTASPPLQAVNGLADSPAASPCAEVEQRGEEEDDDKEKEEEEAAVAAEAVLSVQPVAPTAAPPSHRDETKEPTPTPTPSATEPLRPADAPALIPAAAAAAVATATLLSSSSSSSSTSRPAPTASALGPPPGLPPLVPPPALEETQSREAAVVAPDVTDAPTRKPDTPVALAADAEDAHKQTNSRKPSATGGFHALRSSASRTSTPVAEPMWNTQEHYPRNGTQRLHFCR